LHKTLEIPIALSMGYEVDVVQVGVACLGLIGIGFLLSRFSIFPADEFKALGSFTTNFAFPFLLFRSLAARKIREISFLPFIDAILMSASLQAIVGLICFVCPFKDKLYTYLCTVLCSAYINYIIIGLPIFNAIWGNEYDHVPAICVFNHYILLVPLFLILAQLWKIKKAKAEQTAEGEQVPGLTLRDVGMAFWTALKTPLVTGIFLGLIYSAIGLDYPIFLKYISKYMGDIVLVFAMCGIGRFLQVNSIMGVHWGQLLSCLFLRFFVSPGLAALFAWILKLDGRLARQCTILSCLPAANAAFVLGTSVGIGADVASAMVFWTLIFIVPVLIFWFFILDHFQLFPDAD
jgi:predicted permease